MVSRTQRTQSQPRPSRGVAGRPVAQSFDAWENVNDNIRPPHRHPQAGAMERRAMSSMRYQSNGRGPMPQGMAGRPAPHTLQKPHPQHPQQHMPAGMAMRPRAVSAGRIRRAPSGPQQAPPGYREDPNDVTRQILDLRERREASSQQKRRTVNASPLKTRASPSPSTQIQKPRAASPQGRVLRQSGSNMSQEEIVAEKRLARAENKISGLLDELEELKFFEELESEKPSAPLPKTPSHKTATPRNIGPTTPRTPAQKPAQTPRGPTPGSLDRPQSRGREDPRIAGIPLNIRTVSPARGGRLPPPPPSNGVETPRAPGPLATPNKVGLETYRPLSPRAISRLDRNSLELECQTLVRKMQIIEQERNSQAAMIEMYEVTQQDNDRDKMKISKLQGELGKVSNELKRQLQNIAKGKETLVKDYEEKLQNNLSKLHRVQEKADSYKMELDVTKEEAKRAQEELERYTSKLKDEKVKAESSKSREGTLELQLTEARNLNATLVKKVEKKRAEITNLQNQLSQNVQQLRDTQMKHDEEYTAKLSKLEEELHEAQDRNARIEQDFKDRDQQASEYENKLDMAQIKQSEDAALIEELQARIDELEKETVAKYEEGKKASKSQETRKMQEIVADRANQTREYERRIKAMQEQLRHQADRHHADIQETRRRNDERLEAMRDEIRDEIQLQEGSKIAKLETELSVLRRNYEEAKEDFSNRLKSSQQKARDAAADFQRQDEARQEELDHLHERIDAYVADLQEKEKDLTEMANRLDESRKSLEAMETVKTQNLAEIAKKNDQLELEREKAANREFEFKAQMEAVKAGFDELEDRLRSENEDLQKQMDDSAKKLSEVQSIAKDSEALKERLSEMQTSLDEAEKKLKSEQARHEDVESELRIELAKIEGKLRASESSLKMKKSRVQELETQLDVATATSSKVGEEKQTEILSLRGQLEEVNSKLDAERARVQEKEGEVMKLKTEVSTLEVKLQAMDQLEEVVHDMKRKVTQMQYDNSQKESKLAEMARMYEETRSKMLDAEQRCTMAKSDLEAVSSNKEKLIERYDKSIKELEVKLDKERENSSNLESDLSDVKLNLESLEREKIRKETEFSNLRKDYEELSNLLEENLHSSAKKDEIDFELQRREREMRETVDRHNRNVEALEEKLKAEEKAKLDLEKKIKALQESLNSSNDEKIKLRSEASSLRQKYENVNFEFESYRELHEESRGGIEAELGRKDRHIRETVQRYTSTIADLESKLEEESQNRLELEDKLASARSELEDKQHQTQELIQKHTKSSIKLETDLKAAIFERDELQTRLEQTNRDLEQKRKELKNTVSKFSNEVSELQNVKQEHDEYRHRSETVQEELDRKTREIDELRRKIPELLADLQAKSRECDDHKAAAKRFEVELAKRKEQLNDTVKKYKEQLAILESQLDEQSVARSTTEGRVESARAESLRKDTKIRDLQGLVKELETMLDIANKNKDAAKQKADAISRELDEKDADVRKFEMEKIEFETKLNTQSRAKDELRAKVSDLSSKLERKEREVREVTDRYKMYIMELESKLDQDSDAKHQLQREIDRLKSNLSSAAEVSQEANELREKVYSLEKAVENYRGKARDAEFKSKDSMRSLEDKLSEAKQAKEEVEVALQKVQGEKAEVIAALEGVINEVQNREDEIESLSELLHRRDEELQHAKIIATKALQSAKDIQKRYKDKDETLQSDMMDKMDALTDNLDTLTSKNETLERKISMLERDLRDKTRECNRLKDQLRQIDGNGFADRDPVKDDASTYTQSTIGSTSRVDSFPNPVSSGSHGGSRGSRHSRGSRDFKISTSGSIDPEGIGMGIDSFSPGSHPNNSPTGEYGGDDMFNREVEFASFGQKDGTEYDGDGAASTIVTSDVTDRWSQEYETESGFESVSSEPFSKSRRSVERDALRKYVRQRYMGKR